MKYSGFWWWLMVLAGSVLLSVWLHDRIAKSQLPPDRPSTTPGYYQLHTEKLQDGTFCVIAQSRAGSAYGAVALSCDFTCRDVLNEGAVCK